MLGNARIDAGRRALAHLDPARVLERGYSIVEHAGRVLRDSAQVATGDRIQVRLAHGALAADVSSTDAGE